MKVKLLKQLRKESKIKFRVLEIFNGNEINYHSVEMVKLYSNYHVIYERIYNSKKKAIKHCNKKRNQFIIDYIKSEKSYKKEIY